VDGPALVRLPASVSIVEVVGVDVVERGRVRVLNGRRGREDELVRLLSVVVGLVDVGEC
jgi:hypothetical protein